MRITTRTADGVEAVAKIPHKPVPLADDLGARQCLEAAHRACSALAQRAPMLMVTLDPLLHELAFDVFDLR